MSIILSRCGGIFDFLALESIKTNKNVNFTHFYEIFQTPNTNYAYDIPNI